ncbi:Glycosyltransferase involved in cell wall bisynthesis [Jiangella sp. DSM 45060]|nr:Glycosyltransferase involved in cell wall bisynthesis [Jiangella sp. DSM 45060]
MTSPRKRATVALQSLTSELAKRASPSIGPRRWSGFVAGTRLAEAQRLLRAQPGATIELARPVARVPRFAAAAWRLIAAAEERTGNPAAALEAVSHAVDAGGGSVANLVMRWRLADRLGEVEEADSAVRRLAATAPEGPRDLERIVEALRGADPDLVRAFAAVVAADPRAAALNRDGLTELLDEIALVESHEAGEDAYAAELTRILRTSTAPLKVVTRALTRCRAWQPLAEFIAVTPTTSPSLGPRGQQAPYPAADIAIAAKSALSAGAATAASIMAARTLARRPADESLRATFASAHDQIVVARRPWPFPKRAARPAYDPDPRSVLAVLSQSLPARSGGYATRSHGVLTAMAARGYRMNAVTRLGFPYDRWSAADTRTVPAQDVVDGIAYDRLLEDGKRAYPQYPLASYVDRFERGVQEVARSHRAGLIHASSFYVTGMAGLTAARRLGVPFVYELRGLEELMKVSRDPAFEGSDRHRFLDRLETGVAAGADAVFVITEALGREMEQRGVSADRIVVVPNGVHTSAFAPMPRDAALEAELGLRGRTVIGYVGGLVDYEGLDVLLRAVAGLKATRDDVHLLIVGDGPAERSLHADAARLRLGDVVTFAGRVPHSEVARYLSLIDIAPFPRLPLPVCELISPIKPFESMAMGKAVVVSDVAALAEFVEDGVTGRTVRKGDADDLRGVLEELLGSPDQRRRLGEAAREWVVRERDWRSITATVDETYEALLTGHLSGPGGG